MESRARTDETGGVRALAVVYLKGVCMGAADAVPGVSGGTIALIVGIYERLIDALTTLSPRVLADVLRLHTSDGRTRFARRLVEMDVPFLTALGLGVVTAVFIMTGVMHAAVTGYPAVTYAFFFGLIGASAVVLRGELWLTGFRGVLAAAAGFVLAFVVSGEATGAGADPALPFVFVAGALAVSAMLLPGVSGSFILVLLGQYEYLTEIPGRFVDLLLGGTAEGTTLLSTGLVVAVLISGALVGLLTISHAVRYALTTHRRATLTFLVALIVGALRAPAVRIDDAVGVWSPEMAGVVLAAAVIGAVLVGALNYVTDDVAV
ncbi:DUF368 domain-containing protein [Halobacteriales archaeon QH_7_65_31]|nr:MAG: DUF368 domain-containing protein [Halobacteriales archaeon QH_7_65_31]